MLKSITLPSPIFNSSSSRKPTKIYSTSSRSKVHIPNLEPFSRRSKIERGVKEPSFIEKSETVLLDYCSVLEGDESFNCWRAYFELKDLQRELAKDEVEKLIRQTEGVNCLIDCLHGVSEIHKRKNEKSLRREEVKEKKDCPVPDGLPRSVEEVEEEETARMPDSAFTRLLRTKGRFPAWFSPAPDHETD